MEGEGYDLKQHVREGLTEKVVSEQRPEGDKETSFLIHTHTHTHTHTQEKERKKQNFLVDI